jgi:hypothetical protein
MACSSCGGGGRRSGPRGTKVYQVVDPYGEDVDGGQFARLNDARAFQLNLGPGFIVKTRRV